MDRKQEILRRLTEAEDFVSGQELCELLGVSRTAVWKNIRKLKDEGYPIEAVTNKGYRLLSTGETDIFTPDRIEAGLKTAWAGRPLVFKDETGSTNEDIFALAAEGYPHGTLVTAARQTAGKGRRGRTWISPTAGNIYMSILLKPDLPPDVTPMLTVVMALSACQAAQEIAGGQEPAQAKAGPAGDLQTAGTVEAVQTKAGPAEAIRTDAGGQEMEGAPGTASPDMSCRFGIKWPNDIVGSVNGGSWRKLCGILTEMRMEDREISAITIGIGLNVNQTDFDPEISGNASSFRLCTGRVIDRAALTASVWNHFEENYAVFEKTRDFSGLRPAYESMLVNLGREVHVLDPRTPFTGRALGINDSGELLVRPDDGGAVREIGSGEVSVRGVRGYV